MICPYSPGDPHSADCTGIGMMCNHDTNLCLEQLNTFMKEKEGETKEDSVNVMDKSEKISVTLSTDLTINVKRGENIVLRI